MRRKTLRLLACSCAMAIGTATMANKDAFAQAITVDADIVTGAALTLALVNDIDFGTWVIGHDGTNDVTFSIDCADTTTNGSSGTSNATRIGGTPASGEVSVTAPGAVPINVYASAAAFSTLTQLSVTAMTYDYDVSASSGALSMASGSPTTFTATDNALQPFLVGATITASGTPAASTTDASTITLTFSY